MLSVFRLYASDNDRAQVVCSGGNAHFWHAVAVGGTYVGLVYIVFGGSRTKEGTMYLGGAQKKLTNNKYFVHRKQKTALTSCARYG